MMKEEDMGTEEPKIAAHAMSAENPAKEDGPTQVVDRLKRLQVAVTQGGEFFDPFVAARAQDDLRRTQTRMDLGADLTVAALVGGTGSGKSTLFNAITELNFADSGELRPTTERAAACTWQVDASAMLDYLEVDMDRRIEHESILTSGDNRLNGLVLLDLPDHDSVQVAHSAQVSRLIPMVDMLIWVLDPQKYADQVLHQGYLEDLRDRADSMIVVLNQIDTVPETGREILLADLRQLLDRDGLEGVPLYTTSALEHTGIKPIRQELADAVARREASVRTAAAELDAIIGRLRGDVGGSEAELRGEMLADINDRIVRASGVPAVAESIRDAGGSLGATALAQPEQPANTMMVAIRDAWMAHVRKGLPDRWQNALARDVVQPDSLRRSVGTALRSVALPVINRTPAYILIGLGAVLAIVGVVLGIVGVPVAGAGGRVAVALGGVALGVLLYWLARRQLAGQARAAGDAFERDVRAAIAETTENSLVKPAEAILSKHKLAREALNK